MTPPVGRPQTGDRYLRLRLIGVAFLLVLIGLIGLRWAQPRGQPTPASAPPADGPTAPVPPAGPAAPAADERPRPASPLALGLHAAGGSDDRDLEIVRDLLDDLRRAHGVYPPGQDNADFTAALQGRNPTGRAPLPIGHVAVRDGRLVDRRGAPYVFHLVARDVIEIRSPGPDGQPWTADDGVAIGGRLGTEPALTPPSPSR